ncbi:conserved hypothetical protein [Aspergillus fumigatus A1163]|uniref:Uncharacterized protein n=1 Tax=Aspergillus fumigatus (strain CBS 144.89 / FGSC A1163 / CEA10) TaxID=451804 RepID=B0XVQ5_ASPFC|nr:conserved hypothetical protein [Aspergillus fumigatus A1163]
MSGLLPDAEHSWGLECLGLLGLRWSSLMSQTSASTGTQWWLSHIEFHHCFPFRKKSNIGQNLQFPHPFEEWSWEKAAHGPRIPWKGAQ